MKVAILKGIKSIEFEEFEALNFNSFRTQKNISQSEDLALINVKACGICSSDLDRFNKGAYFYPLILGHEIAGQIVEVSNEKHKNLLHKKAVVFPLLPCKRCEYCLSGHFAQCVDYNYFGSRCNGGFSEFLIAPVSNVKIFDDSFDYLSASLCEPAAVARHALLKIGPDDENVLIVGSGTIGILLGVFARLEGKKVHFLVQNEKKATFLQDLGFETIAQVEQKFQACFECVGTEQALELCLQGAKARAKIVLVGNPKNDIKLSQKLYWQILRLELNVLGIWNSHYPKDWNFVLTNLDKIPASKLITHTFKLEECEQAFELLNDKNVFKIKGSFINE